MARNTRANAEKAKVKVIFRLQFHASHIPQPGWNNLFISVIPSNSGKATARTNKANVRNGTCKWVDPIYETTKLLQDSKTKQYEENLYKLLVAMGTSRSSLLGVANINLSDYVDAPGTTVVALRLQGSDSGAILHVTVQLLTSKTGFRDFQQQKEASDQAFPANTDPDGGKLSAVEEETVPRANMGNPRIILKPDPEEESGFFEGHADTTAGFHGLSNTLGSLYAEKHENSITRGTFTISSDIRSVSPSQSPTMNKEKFDNHSLLGGTSHWVQQWGPETSVDQEMDLVYEENNRLKGDLKAADLSIQELRKEIASLQNFADRLGVEAQKLTEQVAVETSSEQNLAEEVSVLKSECLKFRGDLEFFRNLKMDSDNAISDTVLVPEFCHPEGILVTSETSSMEANKAMQEEIFKIQREVDEAKLEQENLVRKMDEMECDYIGIIQDLEVKQKQLLDELQNLRHEHSSCISTFPSTKAQMEVMHQQNFRLSAQNKELEQRVANSEDALRKTKKNYSSTVDQLQKDLELLSLQVLSMFKTNETLIGKALSEASEQSFQDTDVNQNMESQLPSVIKNHHVGSSRLLEDVKSSVESPKDLCMKMQEELSEMHLANINLNIFSVTLHHALLEASLSIDNEICTLHENKAVSDSISSDLALENRTLDGKLRSVSNEKCLISDKIRELESLVDHYRSYKSKYEDCNAEKANLMNQLEQVATGKHHLSNEVSILQEEMMTMKIKISESEKFQQMVNHIEERLEELLGIGEDRINGLPPCSKEEKNIGCDKLRSIVMHLEDCLQNFNDKILRLMEENKILLNERNIARASFANAEARVMGVKQKFEHDVQDIVISEIEGKCTQMTRDLLFDFTMMEAALTDPTLENRDLVDKVKAFGNVVDELEVNKATVDELKLENLSVTGLLHGNIDETTMLTNELDTLKGTMVSLHDEMSSLRGLRDQHDIQILDLNCQLKERDKKLALLYRLNKALQEKLTTSEFQLLETHGFLIAMDVVQTVVVKQYKIHVEELFWQLEYTNNSLEETNKKNLDQTSRLSNCLLRNRNFAAENSSLLSDLESQKSILEYYIAFNQELEHSNSCIVTELREYKTEGLFEIEELKCLLKNSETEIEDLIFLKEELETRLLVVQATFDEISAQISSREKRKAEGSSYASRETLRIAFIKEQYETKLQEICDQLSISEKHGGEMLRKLQNALDDLENTKKHEASQRKRNEELLLKIDELEIELHMVLADNREKFTAYEQMKAEMDCSIMSLDCCKDDKNQLMTTLKECNDYKCKLGDEVKPLREPLENHKASMRHVLINPQAEQKFFNVKYSVMKREALVTTNTEELSDLRNSENDVKHNEDLLNNQLKPHVLLSIIERLQKELEQMTSENSLLSGDENPDDLAGEVSQRDLVHLKKASEDFESMSSLHNDSLRKGHTMEKGYTSELELADASPLNKNSSIQFQSSVLKLHSDEAAVLQSFRDMLEMKERYCVMETELKEMHERYSQLSLDFAEVEGERQKLTLMLKKARPSKKGS
ncbi:hypothetical protein KSS87_004525 [Heliosperma pusillum]|nr:hypothetical protein KSS87_004525 [Heliosperma pusillum]